MQYWEKVLKVPLSGSGKGIYRFLSPILGKGSIGSPVQYCVRVVGSPVLYWVKVVYVLKSITGKRF